MIIIEDTRQKADKHKLKNDSFLSMGDKVVRSKLPLGDYALLPRVFIDTKEDVLEIAYNMCGNMKEKKRFAAECKLAKECGVRFVVLIEDGRYQKPTDLIGETFRLHNSLYVKGKQLATAMCVMSERYGVEFKLCDKKDTAYIIREMLQDGEKRLGDFLPGTDTDMPETPDK